MKDWICGPCDEVDRLAAQDPYYRQLDASRRELEPRCRKILETLSETDREILTEYEYLITELAYQKTQTAYHLGCQKRQ